MSQHMKYISFSLGEEFEHLILFDFILDHSTIADALRKNYESYVGFPFTILGAGMVGKEGEHLNCFGDSFTLKITSRKEDNILLEQYLNDH
ncbi:hypothetical protein LCGC14_0729540 [marine sediment metagenome]|uniref:Uncharacterized protein n=1 Tax=marine sediment metagenome TaxID=412755 RepID=A0A0F9QV23_9ZZZZ